MPSRDHHTHILSVKGDESLIAVVCSTCRTAAFYKHTWGADRAMAHHRQACSAPAAVIVPILGTEAEERARRAPIPE